MSLKNKLNRLKKHVVREEQNISNIVENNSENPLWEEHHSAIFSYDSQHCIIREVTYPLEYQHGLYQLGEIHSIVSMWNNSHLTHPLSCKGHHASELFFFDTETTGLGGGAGNTIFLLGQAQVFPDRVVIKQHLLPQPGNEVALYQSFLQGINSKTLVTYNGKAFDWPQVKTRHTLIRESVPSLPAFGHFDLFHAARRLWKNDLESVRLSNVEKEILNISRENDVPGFLAPMIYFQFVKEQRPEIILGVLKHNEIDVLSLITLYIHLSLKILKTENEATEAEHFEIARWLDYVGDEKSAIHSYQSLIEKGSSSSFEAKFALANHHKKEKEWQKSITAWKEIITSSSNEVIVRKSMIELAKFYEHKEKDFELALHYSNLVYNMMKEMEHISSFSQIKDIEKRIARLNKKYSPGKRK
jgi:uncharacterized protein